MNHIARIAAVALIAASLGGCQAWQTAQQAYEAALQAKVSYKYALVTVATYNGLETAGAEYLNQPTCTATQGFPCHDRRATKPMKAAFVAGRIARDQVLAYIKTNPCDPQGLCPLMPDGVIGGLKGWVAALQSMYATYNVTYGS